MSGSVWRRDMFTHTHIHSYSITLSITSVIPLHNPFLFFLFFLIHHFRQILSFMKDENPIVFSLHYAVPHIYTILNQDNKAVQLVWIDSFFKQTFHIFIISFFVSRFKLKKQLNRLYIPRKE